MKDLKYSTSLQRDLNSVRESYGNKLENDSNILNEITKIAGNRGYSHKLRWEMIGARLESVDLNSAGREYVSKLADVSQGYIVKTKKLSGGRVRLARDIMYKVDAAKKISSIRREYSGLSGIQKLGILEASLAQNISEVPQVQPYYRPPQAPELVYHPVQTINRKETSKQSFWKRATKIAGKVAAALIIGSGIGAALSYLNSEGSAESNIHQARPALVARADANPSMNYSLVRADANPSKYLLAMTKEKPKKVTEEKPGRAAEIKPARNYEKEITDLRGKIAEKENRITGLKSKLDEAGRPDNEVVAETTRNADVKYIHKIDRLTRENNKTLRENNTLAQKLKRYEERDAVAERDRKAKEKAEEIRVREAEAVHGIVSRLNLPSFPIARAVIDPKTGIAKEILEIDEIDYTPSQGFDLINTPQELRKIARVIGRVYEPANQDDMAFENFAGPASAFVPDKKGVSDLDKFVMFSQEYRDRGVISWGVDSNGKVVRPSEEQKKDKKKMEKFMAGLKEIVVIGNVDQIKSLKGDK